MPELLNGDGKAVSLISPSLLSGELSSARGS